MLLKYDPRTKTQASIDSTKRRTCTAALVLVLVHLYSCVLFLLLVSHIYQVPGKKRAVINRALLAPLCSV